MDTRFVAISTGNTQPLLTALGEHCDAIRLGRGADAPKHAGPDVDLTPELVRELDAIAERNVTRRRIRYPKLFGNRLVAAAYRSGRRRRARQVFRQIHRTLAADTSRTVLVFNGYLAPNALLALAADTLSMPRLFIENGFYPGTMQCDPQGINALSTLPRDGAFYDGLSEDMLGDGWPEDFETRKSKLRDGNVAAAADDLPERYIFVPFQVPSDMQILALSPWIGSMVQLYGEIAALAEAFPDRRFVIKEHPSFPLSIQDVVSSHSHIRFANSANTRELIEGADAVITVNSTVGLEALTLAKKVVTLGEAHYNIDGLVLHASDRTTLHAAVAELDRREPDDARRRRFIRFVYNRFLVPLSRTDPGDSALTILQARAAGGDAYSQALAGSAQNRADDIEAGAARR